MDCSTNLDDYLKTLVNFKKDKLKIFDLKMDDLKQIKNYSLPQKLEDSEFDTQNAIDEVDLIQRRIMDFNNFQTQQKVESRWCYNNELEGLEREKEVMRQSKVAPYYLDGKRMRN